ncbi:SNPC5 protein, partial [Cochlearius cochlearius]|nr:SNPC5 protein [Cochlearius cochlearius]
MLSRLQELRKEEETLLRVKAALHEQLTRLRVEELALQSMISSREENATASSSAAAEEAPETLGQMDNEAAINQTELHLSLQDHEEEEEEEDEESDS